MGLRFTPNRGIAGIGMLSTVVGPTGATGATGATGSTGATGPGYTATSTTSIAIASSGSKAFTTQSGLAYTVGARVRATDAANTANWMEGLVSAYSGTTLTFTADLSNGSGTIASWNINLAGDRGATGATGATGPSGAVGISGTPNANEYPRWTNATTLEARTVSQVRSDLGLVIGTNVQAYDATLLSIAALGTAADRMLYTTGVDTWAELAVTSVGRGLLDDTTTAAQLATLTARGQGKETIFIPASAMRSRTTNGAAAGAVEQTTNKNMVVSLDFDTTTQEFAQFAVWFPKSWNLGTVTFQPTFSQLTTAAGGVVFGLAGVAVSDGDALDVAYGTAQTSTKTAGTANLEYQGPESSAITIAGTPAAGDRVMFQINRTVADASDTLAQDARLHGVRLFFTTNAATDT